jgi:predicted AlkP superfamily pyrophosphatase or phosphodiesterase
MENIESYKAIEKLLWNDLLKPAFGNYCYTNINSTILDRLCNIKNGVLLPSNCFHADSKYKNVILILVDCFGWSFFKQFANQADSTALYEIQSNSIVSKLTSQFPTTTTVHITNIHTGMPITESGICEWTYYESRLDRVIKPFLMRDLHQSNKDDLIREGIHPDHFVPKGRFLNILASNGVKSYIYGHKDYALSPYNLNLGKSAESIAYTNFNDGLTECYENLIRRNEKTYSFIYTGDLDSANHFHGPDSEEVKASVISIFSDIKLHLIDKLRQKNSANTKNTLVMITADHGGVAVNSALNIYLEESHPELRSFLKTNAAGLVIEECGSQRDLFLHVQEKYLPKVYKQLKSDFQGLADVFTLEELIKIGIFGPITNDFFKSNIGNLIILPREGNAIYSKKSDSDMSQKFKGSHGGLSPKEMEIPLLTLEI